LRKLKNYLSNQTKTKNLRKKREALDLLDMLKNLVKIEN
jgi:hypothetical protein